MVSLFNLELFQSKLGYRPMVEVSYRSEADSSLDRSRVWASSALKPYLSVGCSIL